jgi:hypothetical protein
MWLIAVASPQVEHRAQTKAMNDRLFSYYNQVIFMLLQGRL